MSTLFKFILLSFWYDAPLTSRDSDRKHDPWLVYGSLTETSTFPNWDGTEQKRPFTVTSDELKYTVAAASGGGTVTIVWKRTKLGM